MHWIGMGVGGVIMLLSLFLINSKIFFLLIGVGALIGSAPFVFTVIYESKIESEKEKMFLEFARNLVESVKTGTPISKTIMNLKNKYYGVLSGNIQKLANQISLGIPLNTALQIFAKDVNNKTISRAITLIGQSEKSGGDIGWILESVAKAVNMSDRLKKERKATISTLVVQGYIIFTIFIIIILVMQFKILPMVSGIASVGLTGGIQGAQQTSAGINPEEISNAFLYLILIQGFFSGLTIGQLAEGNIKAGIKHSFILMCGSFLISTAASLFLG